MYVREHLWQCYGMWKHNETVYRQILTLVPTTFIYLFIYFCLIKCLHNVTSELSNNHICCLCLHSPLFQRTRSNHVHDVPLLSSRWMMAPVITWPVLCVEQNSAGYVWKKYQIYITWGRKISWNTASVFVQPLLLTYTFFAISVACVLKISYCDGLVSTDFFDIKLTSTIFAI